MTSPLAQWAYEPAAYDLVRYRTSELDDTLRSFVAQTLASDELLGVRHQLDDDDAALLAHYAQRRFVAARRDGDATALAEAFDAVALLRELTDGFVAVWIKAGLLFATELDMDIDALFERFDELAPAESSAKVRVARESLERLEHLAQCQLVETHTSYGLGLLNTIVMREATSDSPIMASFGVPVQLGAYEAGFNLASRVAGIAAVLADAFDEMTGHHTNELHHDQLVAACFDVVTSGSFLPAQACVSFHVNAPNGLAFSVVVADIDPEHTGYSAQALADMADDLAEQAAVSSGSYVVLLTVVPDFDDLLDEVMGTEPVDDDEDAEGDTDGFDDEDDVDADSDTDDFDDDPLSIYVDAVASALAAAVGHCDNAEERA